MIKIDCKQKDSKINPTLSIISLSPILWTKLKFFFSFLNSTRVELIPPNNNHYFEMNDQNWL